MESFRLLLAYLVTNLFGYCSICRIDNEKKTLVKAYLYLFGFLIFSVVTCLAQRSQSYFQTPNSRGWIAALFCKYDFAGSNGFHVARFLGRWGAYAI
jgi:hypothetical protein